MIPNNSLCHVLAIVALFCMGHFFPLVCCTIFPRGGKSPLFVPLAFFLDFSIIPLTDSIILQTAYLVFRPYPPIALFLSKQGKYWLVSSGQCRLAKPVATVQVTGGGMKWAISVMPQALRPAQYAKSLTGVPYNMSKEAIKLATLQSRKCPSDTLAFDPRGIRQLAAQARPVGSLLAGINFITAGESSMGTMSLAPPARLSSLSKKAGNGPCIYKEENAYRTSREKWMKSNNMGTSGQTFVKNTAAVPSVPPNQVVQSTP